MRFHEPSGSRRHRRPPNYFSRRWQWQLLLLVFSLMFVLVLMERARDPSMYAWMWSNEQQKQAEFYKIDLPREANHQEQRVAETSDQAENAADPTAQAWQAAVRDAWQYAVQQLSLDSVERLAQALTRCRQKSELSPSLLSDLADAIDEMDSGWQQYLANAQEDFQRASAKQEQAVKSQWQDVLARLDSHWNAEVKPALRAIVDGSATSYSDDLFDELQQSIDERTLAEVKDNTFFQRSERTAWFRLLERLQNSNNSRLTNTSSEVTYLQLFRQPNSYRGKLVRINGSVRQGHWVAAQENALGIERYAVLWIKPNQANAPIELYCLDLPAGFPQLADSTRGELPTSLNVPVAITGYFFKRHAYRSKGGVDVAPLILVAEPQITGTPVVTMAAPPSAAPRYSMSPRIFMIAACVAALIAALLVFVMTAKRRKPDMPARLNGMP